MNIEFRDLKNTLNISKLSHLKVITFEDYAKAYIHIIDFPPGAHEIKIILAKEDAFNSISDFLMHVMSIPWAKRVAYKLPSGFYDRSFFLSELTSDQFVQHLDAYFEGFFEHLYPISPGLNLWKIQMNIDDYEKGYKVEGAGTSQVLICQTSAYYLYFISQSID